MSVDKFESRLQLLRDGDGVLVTTALMKWNELRSHPVASIGSWGVDRPRWHPPGGDTLLGVTPKRKKILWASLERIVDRRGQTGEKGAGWHPSEINKSDSDEQKKSSVFQEKINKGASAELTDRQLTVMPKKEKKKGQFFRKKIGVTPSVAAPGDGKP